MLNGNDFALHTSFQVPYSLVNTIYEMKIFLSGLQRNEKILTKRNEKELTNLTFQH